MGGTERRGPQIAAGAFCGSVTGGLLAVLMVFDDVSSVSLLPVGTPSVQIALHLVVAAAIGAVFGWISPRTDRAHAALTSSGLIIGLLWWVIGPLTFVPIIRGDGTMWSLVQATPVFSTLIASLLHGSATGLCFAVVGGPRILPWSVPTASRGVGIDENGDQVGDDEAQPAEPTRVVIVGGGFGGVAVAQRLEALALDGSGIDVTLVSDRNFLLFTPMLAEVAGSSVEQQHISAPLRAACPRTRFVRGRATDIDVEARLVRVAEAPRGEVCYDHLVVALGSVPDDRDVPGVADHCFSLKTLDDATRLRNHVISMMERADVETDGAERRSLLTFVVAGGGFAGTEMVAELCDLAHSALRHYPSVPIDELRFVLVHSRDRILPEIGAELADYALDKLHARGIETVLGTHVDGVTPTSLTLDAGTEIATRTVVWTAGNQPNALVTALGCELGDRGAVVTDATLAVTGLDRVWALGDCAQVPDSEGGRCPPTAQHATRQGTTVADNILAVEQGRDPSPFSFSSLGTLVALGHRTAVAEIRGRRFSGILAWFMWRTIYLFKLPTLEKKARVVVDWTVDLLFPRDIVLTTDSPQRDLGDEPERDDDHTARPATTTAGENGA